MSRLKLARKTNDSIRALAVLQQCTRKNVGGIMSYEMFSHTNSGQPKKIVEEFIEEVERTLRWVTQQANQISDDEDQTTSDLSFVENTQYTESLHLKTNEEKNNVRVLSTCILQSYALLYISQSKSSCFSILHLIGSKMSTAPRSIVGPDSIWLIRDT